MTESDRELIEELENVPHNGTDDDAVRVRLLAAARLRELTRPGVESVVSKLPNPKCGRCGDTPSCGDGAWRWAGDRWQHRCRGDHPQVGYMDIAASDSAGVPEGWLTEARLKSLDEYPHFPLDGDESKAAVCMALAAIEQHAEVAALRERCRGMEEALETVQTKCWGFASGYVINEICRTAIAKHGTKNTGENT